MRGSIQGTIQRFIFSQVPDGEYTTLEPTGSFLQKGLLDSMGIMQLVAFVQKEYDIRVLPREIVPDHFDSLEKVERYILKKQSQGRRN